MAIAHSRSHPEKAFFLNQHGNLNDGLAHEQTTGKELWDQTEGRLDSVVIGLGTSGTFDGLSKFLKYKNSNIKIIAYEPASSPVYSCGKQGKYTHIGVGPGFITENFKLSRHNLDELIHVENEVTCEWTRLLARREG